MEAKSSSKHTPGQDDERKTENTLHHIAVIRAAVHHLEQWPCVTTLNNLRNAVDHFERSIRSGDAAIAKASA